MVLVFEYKYNGDTAAQSKARVIDIQYLLTFCCRGERGEGTLYIFRVMYINY